MAESKEKYTLITNVAFAQFQSSTPRTRLWCYAVLLTENAKGFFGNQNEIRGFGSDAAYPIFTAWLEKDAFPYTVSKGEDRSTILIGCDGKEKPIFGGAIFNFGDGAGLYINAEDGERPLDIQTFGEGQIERIWEVLQEKVAEYWQAPNMPVISYRPASLVRSCLPSGI